jgi:hypothetical protein
MGRRIVLSWSDIDRLVSAVEKVHPHERIVKVIAPCTSAPDLWHGDYTNAPVVYGELGVQWNSGRFERLALQ